MFNRRMLVIVAGCIAVVGLLLFSQGSNAQGVVEFIDVAGRTVTISHEGVPATYYVPAEANIRINGQPGKLEAITPGARATLHADSNHEIGWLHVKLPSGAAPAATEAADSSEQSVFHLASAPVKSGKSDLQQFNGARRDNKSTATGLLSDWPEAGPNLAWEIEGIGEAYSAVSVTNGKIYTMGNIDNVEYVFCLNADDGSQVWKAENGAAYFDGTGNGPRGTPAVDGDRVYALGGNGSLVCLDAETGTPHWQMNILEKFNANNIGWGISESVLIDGDRLICTPGGQDATMVCLEKQTGDLIWKASSGDGAQAGYGSAAIAEVGGVKQYVQFTSRSVIGVRATDGQLLWSESSSANGTANCSSPQVVDDLVFSSSGYGTGSALVRLSSSAGKTTAELIYHTRELKSHHGDFVIVDGYVYGADDGELVCLDLETGNVAWKDRSVGKGALTYADGHIYLRSEGGPVALVKATPDKYEERGRFNQPNRSNHAAWSHPVVAGGKLYLRDMDRLFCYDISAN